MHEEDRVIDEENAAGEGQSAPSFDNAETPKPALSSSPRVQQPKLATCEPPILAQVVHVQTPVHALAPNGGLRERPAPLVRDSCFPGRMLLQAPLQASTRSATQNKLDDPSASATTGVSNGPEDEVCAQPSDADTSDAPVSPVSPTSSTGSEQLRSGCVCCHPQIPTSRHIWPDSRLVLCAVRSLADTLVPARELVHPPRRTRRRVRRSLHATCFSPELRVGGAHIYTRVPSALQVM